MSLNEISEGVIDEGAHVKCVTFQTIFVEDDSENFVILSQKLQLKYCHRYDYTNLPKYF